MEEVNLVIAVGVPYKVEITATGIPIHEARVEFCIPKHEISYNFPARMVDEKKFVFTLTDALENMINQTHDYKLFVYYGNARFEADNGIFNLIDKKAFDVKMESDGKSNIFSEKLLAKTKNKPVKESVDEIDEIVTTTSKVHEEKKEKKIEATKPTPTPTIETTTTLKEAKVALTKEDTPTVTATPEPTVEVTEDANKKVKEILSTMQKTTTPTIEMTQTVKNAQKLGNFFTEVERMKEINAKRKKNKKVKEAINSAKKKY